MWYATNYGITVPTIFYVCFSPLRQLISPDHYSIHNDLLFVFDLSNNLFEITYFIDNIIIVYILKYTR